MSLSPDILCHKYFFFKTNKDFLLLLFPLCYFAFLQCSTHSLRVFHKHCHQQEQGYQQLSVFSKACFASLFDGVCTKVTGSNGSFQRRNLTLVHCLGYVGSTKIRVLIITITITTINLINTIDNYYFSKEARRSDSEHMDGRDLLE